MGIIGRTGDNFFALRFLRLLTMPWAKTAAFKAGVIDNRGNRIKDDLETSDEKSAYTMFHRLAFNIKRLFEKAPGSITRNIASYATALFLLKEECNLSEESLKPIVEFLEIDKLTFFEEITHCDENSVVIGDACGMSITREMYDNLMEELGGDVVSTSSTNIDKHIKGRTFKVPNDVFRRFQFGRNKYERWHKYLQEDDPQQGEIKKYCQKNPSHTIMLQCQDTGVMRAIRRKASNLL